MARFDMRGPRWVGQLGHQMWGGFHAEVGCVALKPSLWAQSFTPHRQCLGGDNSDDCANDAFLLEAGRQHRVDVFDARSLSGSEH